MSVARNHWLLLVTVVALGVAAYFAFGLGSAEAGRSPVFHWHYWNDAWGCVWKDLYYPSGAFTGVTRFVEC